MRESITFLSRVKFSEEQRAPEITGNNLKSSDEKKRGGDKDKSEEHHYMSEVEAKDFPERWIYEKRNRHI